jgi:hypothetical protein
MDPRRFDALSKVVGMEIDRRRMLAGLLAGLGGLLGTEQSQGKPTRTKHRRRADGQKPKKQSRHTGKHRDKREGKQRHAGAEAQGQRNDACAHFCASVFPPGPRRGACVSDAARGAGPCVECGPASESTLTFCRGACVDTDTDPDHCGGCDAPCLASESCRGGDCVPCVAPRATCQAPDICCQDQSGPLTCNPTFIDDGESRCCRGLGGPCNDALDCCANGGSCPGPNSVCGGAGAGCETASQCVSGVCHNHQCVPCVAPGTTCQNPTDCCPDANEPENGALTCGPTVANDGQSHCCRGLGGACSSAFECCAGGGSCPGPNSVCGGNGAGCETPAQCVSGVCHNGQCVACVTAGTTCQASTDCCPDANEPLTCNPTAAGDGQSHCCRGLGGSCQDSFECCAGGGTCPPTGGVCGGAGASCENPSHCFSGTCEGGVCA